MSKFRETQDIGKYLGVHLKWKPLRNEDYMYILDQISNKFTGWKTKQFSFVGRVTMAKRVIEVIPIYHMMMDMLPKARVDGHSKL